MKFTIFGGRGFIGSHLFRKLIAQNQEVDIPQKGFVPTEAHTLGHVIYASGVTGDFHSRPFDTMKAHVCEVVQILERAKFESLLYLSSTRVYGAGDTSEDAEVSVDPTKKDHLYNISKLAGESACFAADVDNVRVVRLSNVCGKDADSQTFFSTVLRSANEGHVRILSSPLSEKDYISIDDVTDLIIKIAMKGKRRLYNVAAGVNITNLEITERVREITKCQITYQPRGHVLKNAPINIGRIVEEFAFQPTNLLGMLPNLIKNEN